MLTLGLSVIIFLVIGVVVMALFCLITKYFNKKLEKALDDENEVYSMIQQIRGNDNGEDAEDEYENYVNKRENQSVKPENKAPKFELEMTDVKQILRGNNDDIYGMGKLKKRLEGGSINVNPETGRSISSLKSFKPEKLDEFRRSNVSNRSKQSDSNTDGSGGELQNDTDRQLLSKRPPRKDKKKDNVEYHKYISKIVSYTEQGIFIIQNNLLSVEKRGEIVEKRNVKNSHIKPEYSSFNDTLEAYGFQKGQFCAFKFSSTLEIPHMKPNEQYPVVSLKNSESKQPIQFPEFYSLRDKLQQIS